MLYPFEKYKHDDCGYWLRKYAQTGGNVDRVHVLIDLNGTDFSGESYFTEPWFVELKKASGVRDFCGNTAGSVAQCTTQNSNFDNTFLNRHAHKQLQPDVLAMLEGMTEGGATNAQINSMLRNVLKSVFDENNESFKRIWAVINETYDPLFNVDVLDEEKHTGTDTDKHTGSDTTAKTGTETLTNDGKDTDKRTGTDTTTKTGSETLTNDGKDTDTTTGSIENAKTGTETTKDGTGSKTTTNNTVFAFDSVAEIPDSGSETLLKTEKITEFNNRKDTQTFNNHKLERDYDSSHETEYDTSDATTYNNTLEHGYDSTHETEYDTSDATTYNSNFQTIHGHVITRTKKGNQGVTMSQDMLTSEIEAWSNIDFLKYVVDTVARDIVLW